MLLLNKKEKGKCERASEREDEIGYSDDDNNTDYFNGV
jgi:hypothetical protein